MTAAPSRLIAVDALRALALVNMVAFHFLFDLRMFGMVPGWLNLGPWFALWAKVIAGSFLFLAGFSLWLGHRAGVRARSFIRRLGVLILAAIGVSVATYFAMPGGWVRFGILHSIALSSVIGLVFLRAPWPVTLAAAAAVFWVGPMLRDPMFDGAAWVWTGLSTTLPSMIDYEPLVPWFAPFLLGLAFGQAGGLRVMTWGPAEPGRWARGLAWTGRHTLAIYLIHQPVLIGLLTAFVWIGRP